MLVYRLENIFSGLGPFQHSGQLYDVVVKGINSSPRHMEDIDHLDFVKLLLTKKNAVFGYKNLGSLKKLLKMKNFGKIWI